MSVDSGDLIGLFGVIVTSGTSFGFAAWMAKYLLRTTLPEMQKRYEASIKELVSAFREEQRDTREHSVSTLATISESVERDRVDITRELESIKNIITDSFNRLGMELRQTVKLSPAPLHRDGDAQSN